MRQRNAICGTYRLHIVVTVTHFLHQQTTIWTVSCMSVIIYLEVVNELTFQDKKKNMADRLGHHQFFKQEKHI